MTPMEFAGAFALGFATCFALVVWLGSTHDDDDQPPHSYP